MQLIFVQSVPVVFCKKAIQIRNQINSFRRTIREHVTTFVFKPLFKSKHVEVGMSNFTEFLAHLWLFDHGY